MLDYKELAKSFQDPAPTAGSAVSGGLAAQFAQQYGAQAKRAGDRLGVDPSILLAQWGLETGWGKSIIPGTNNLGNIKDFSGKGTAATDNMTGSRDKYRQYDSADAFADDFAGLLERKYRGAIGAGSDAARYAQALKAGGYAEDPDYVNKLVSLSGQMRGAGAAAPPARPQYTADSAGVEFDSRDMLRQQQDIEEGAGIGDLGRAAQVAGGHMIASTGWGLKKLTGYGTFLEDMGGRIAERAEEGMSERFKSARAKEFVTEDENGDGIEYGAGEAWSDPWAFASVIVEGAVSLIPMLATSGGAAMIAATRATAAATKVAKAQAIARGLTGQAAQKFITYKASEAAAHAAARAGMLAGGSMEGWLEGTGAGKEVGEEVRGMELADLDAYSPDFRALVESGASPEEAREEVARLAENQASLSAGAVASVTGGVLGHYVGKGMRGKLPPWMGKTRAGRTAKAGAGEFGQEFIQEGSAQAFSNKAIQDYADERQRVWEGVPDMAVRGGIGGAGVGAGLGAISGAPRERDEPAPKPAPNSPLTNAANIAAEGLQDVPPTTEQQPSEFDLRLERVASFTTDKDFIASIRAMHEFGPESVSEMLSAFVKARNPNVDDVVREMALSQLEQFIDTVVRRPNFTFGRRDQTGTDVVAPGTAPKADRLTFDDGMTIDGEARDVGTPPRKLLPADIRRAVDEGYTLEGTELVKPGAEPIALTGPNLAAARQATGSRGGSFVSSNVFTVETQDSGTFEAKVHRLPDGGVVILTPDGVIEYNGAFAGNKTDADMLAYVFEPIGFQQATQQAATQSPEAGPSGTTPENSGFVAGDTVRIRGDEQKIRYVESVGSDGWVYLTSGESFPPGKAAEILFKSDPKPDTGTWGGYITGSPELPVDPAPTQATTAPATIDESIASAQGKTVTRRAKVVETGQVIALKGQDAVESIAELRRDIEAMDSLRVCIGA